MMDQRNQIERRSQRQHGLFRRNGPSVCFFFKSGRTCRAGDKCPMSHKIPRKAQHRSTTLSDPNPDPKSKELLDKAVNMGPVDPPSDQTIKTLYIRRLNSSVHEEHLRDRFSPYGEIESIVYFGLRGVSCAFLTYTTREAAEKAMLEHSSWVVVNGQRLKLLWGGNRIPKDTADDDGLAQKKNGGEVPISSKRGFGSSELSGGFALNVGEVPSWSKRVYGSSELSGGCGFDGIRGWGKWDSWDFSSKNETNAGVDDVKSSGEADNAWEYKPNRGASSSSSGSPWGTGDQW